WAGPHIARGRTRWNINTVRARALRRRCQAASSPVAMSTDFAALRRDGAVVGFGWLADTGPEA
ncbi:MAG: hypothetical protein AAGH45_09685, partial [Pseudomonadota bacterium]